MTTTTIATADSRPTEYGAFAVTLHWVIFLAVIALFAIAEYSETLPREQRGALMDWHKAIGVVVLGLATLRILWIRIHGAPDLVPTSRLTDVLARISHGLLYLLLLAMPLSGLAMVLSAGRGVVLLGIPPLVATPSKAVSGFFHDAHGLIFLTLAGLVALHAAAALWHHYVKHDSTLGRMVPWLRAKA